MASVDRRHGIPHRGRQTHAAIGPQDGLLGPAGLWILPNPSGLNASRPLPRLTEAFRELYEAVREQ